MVLVCQGELGDEHVVEVPPFVGVHLAVAVRVHHEEELSQLPGRHLLHINRVLDWRRCG